jgi:serine protease inhibitor
MAKKLYISILIFLGLFVWQCGSKTTDPYIPPPELSAAEKAMVASSNEFAFEIFKEIVAQETDTNIFISPLSISYALGMCYNGANGLTEDSMRQTLCYGDMTDQQINATYKTLTRTLSTIDPKVIIEIANSIWHKTGFEVEDDFINVNQQYFDSEVTEANFADPAVCDRINAWIEDKTHDKIQDMLDCPIDPMVVMYVINAIYFKGTWTYEFDKDETIEQDFYLADNSTTLCKMMKQRNKFSNLFTDDFKAIDLPYGNAGYSMTVFLPAEGKTTADFISELSEDNWKNWLDSFSTDSVTLRLPKFKIKYGTELKDVLTILGMGIAFSGMADFTGITRFGGIYISRVLHNTFVQVDEEGTEAAAVTVVEFRDTAFEPGKYMCVDRPFVFVIHDNYTGTILFMGRITNPIWENG